MCNEPHYGHLGVASGKNREGKIRKTMRKKINEKIFLSYSPCLVAEYFQLLGGSASLLLEAFNQSLAVGWLGMWKDDRNTGGKLGPDHSLHTVFTHGPHCPADSWAEMLQGNRRPDAPPMCPYLRTGRSKNAPALKICCSSFPISPSTNAHLPLK